MQQKAHQDQGGSTLSPGREHEVDKLPGLQFHRLCRCVVRREILVGQDQEMVQSPGGAMRSLNHRGLPQARRRCGAPFADLSHELSSLPRVPHVPDIGTCLDPRSSRKLQGVPAWSSCSISRRGRFETRSSRSCGSRRPGKMPEPSWGDLGGRLLGEVGLVGAAAFFPCLSHGSRTDRRPACPDRTPCKGLQTQGMHGSQAARE